jgi:hypothetical protein
MLRLVPLACLALSACLMPPAGSGSSGSTAPSSSSSSSNYNDPPPAAPAPASANDMPREPAPSGPRTVSVTIRSACSKTVGVFYGDKPGFSSGTKSSVSSNSVSSKTFTVGDKMWVLDDAGNGASLITISESTRSIEITSSCNGLRG